MREYGQIQCSFWTDPDIQSLSDHAKVLATYLLTGPHSNGIGCYRIPDGYILADLSWSRETVSKGFDELFQIGFSVRCKASYFVLIHKFLRFNPIPNPNAAKARVKEFNLIPNKVSVYNGLVDSLETYGTHWPNGFLNGIERVPEDLPDNKTITRPEQDHDQEQDHDHHHDHTLLSEKSDDIKKNEVAIRILDYLNSVTGKKFRPVESNLKLIRARFKQKYTAIDMMAVIDRKAQEWMGTQFETYLRPATLFNDEKFNQYVGELGKPPQTVVANNFSGIPDNPGGFNADNNDAIDADYTEVHE